MLILASKSPRRCELLKLAGLEFTVCPANGSEELPPDILPADAAERLAKQKAQEIAARFPYDTVIGADTLVAFGKRILGKPENEAAAYEMLKTLSGSRHMVYTGVCIINAGDIQVFSEMTEVEFYPLSDKEILDYIATGEPMDKAGAYGIQGKGFFMVKGIRGDFYNVAGLPLAQTVRRLKAAGGLD